MTVGDLENAQAELIRLERMVVAQRELVNRIINNTNRPRWTPVHDASPRPSHYLSPRRQDRSQVPRWQRLIREEVLTCLGERTP